MFASTERSNIDIDTYYWYYRRHASVSLSLFVPILMPALKGTSNVWQTWLQHAGIFAVILVCIRSQKLLQMSASAISFYYGSLQILNSLHLFETVFTPCSDRKKTGKSRSFNYFFHYEPKTNQLWKENLQ